MKVNILLHHCYNTTATVTVISLQLAVAAGVEMIEFHITLDRTMYGSDQAASIEPRGAFELMGDIAIIEQMMGDKDEQ